MLTITLSLSTMAYIYFSLKQVTHHHTIFNVVNQTQSYTEGLSGKHSFWKIMQTPTALNKPTVSISTKPISVHYHIAHPSNYHFILDYPEKCQQNPFLVLMVPVAPHQVEARNAIRTVMTLFLVGLTGESDSEKAQQQLEEESRQHRDLVQSNFVDSYVNLTIKTMVIMDWLATRCPQANFSMKVDSDMYLNLENLVTLLLAPNTPRQNYITGFLMWNQHVIRNKKSKYYVSEELFPEPTYPTYAYVGICLKRLGIKPSRAPDPSQFRTYMKDSKSHNLSNVITTIARSPKQIIEFWQSVAKNIPLTFLS
ncbi:hypothetical protein PO909_027146 [Leuciscus waleckii]